MGNLKLKVYDFNKARTALLFFFVYFSLFSAFSQNKVFREDNKLKYKEEESYKTISFKVDFIENSNQVNTFIKLFKANPDIFNVSYNLVSKTCLIDSKLNIDNKSIVSITGPAGYKTSEYSEKVNLLIQMPNISREEREKIEYDRAEQNRITNNWPADFPKFINTGNPAKDNEDYKDRKTEWIKNNPEKYKAISSSSKHFETEAEKKEKLEKDNSKK